LKVGIFILAHKRPWLLPLIVEQVANQWPDHIVQFSLDRPTAAVVEAVEDAREYGNVEVFTVPFSPVSEQGDRFMEVRNFQMDKLEPHKPDYAVLWDDDHLLSGTARSAQLMEEGYDLMYVRKRFFWDNMIYTNERFPVHRSVFWFRCIKGDRFPTDRIIHAPVRIHDHPKKVTDLKECLIDIGYLRKEDRERVFKEYARAGKIDAATLPLADEPKLHKYTWHTNSLILRDKIEARMRCL
jgi:hypothetical protein